MSIDGFKPDYDHIRPPGSYYQILGHPTGRNEAVEVAILQDHRFAFYYWSEWRSKLSASPVLISIDWHQDLCAPCDSECEDLRKLDRSTPTLTSLFCWGKINPLNDSHVLSAAYLDLISDVYVLCKQKNEPVKNFKDVNGKIHLIKCHHEMDSFFKDIFSINFGNIILDIDLDYFTESDEHCGGGKNLKLTPDREIENIVSPHSKFMQWIFKRFVGMTIATEPKFCGGFSNSNHIFSIIDKTLFQPQLLSPDCSWKHLQKS